MWIITDIWPKNDFSKCSKKGPISRYVDIILSQIWPKIDIDMYSKKGIFLEMWIITEIWPKNDFSKCSQKEKNVLFLDMLIFLVICAKTSFSSFLRKIVFLKVISKVRALARNVNIFGHMAKNDFTKWSLKSFFLKWRYEEKQIFFKEISE